MKIVHIIESFGGGCLTFLSLLTAHLPHEWEQTIIYSKRKESPENPSLLFLSHIKLKYINMGMTKNPLKLIKIFIKLVNVIREENPDIIHCHSSIAGFWGRIIGKILGT